MLLLMERPLPIPVIIVDEVAGKMMTRGFAVVLHRYQSTGRRLAHLAGLTTGFAENRSRVRI